MTRNGHQAVLDQLIADGVRHIFGNPGTVEQGFLDALGDHPNLHYVLTLQESIAIYAADAYARARGFAVAQIHSSPGLGNSIGALYQANRGQSPILVIGGDAGIQYQAFEAQMAADLVAMARPVTKWSTMVQHPGSLLRVLRRAIKVAQTPPMGPVYVCLPQDVLDAVAVEAVVPTLIPDSRVLPDISALERAADVLLGAARPNLYIGDGVAQAAAQAELSEVAELLGADVWGVDGGDLNFSWRHPLWRGQTGHMFGSHSRPITQAGDVNLIVGTYMLPEVFPALEPIFAADAQTLHIDLDAGAIAKNHPVDMGLLGHPRLTLAALAKLLRQRATEPQRAQAADRWRRAQARSQPKPALQGAAGEVSSASASGRLNFATLMAELAPRLPADAIIFDEALTNSPALTDAVRPETPGAFFQTRGGSLGTALAGSLGLQAAHPERLVVAVSGDGGAMYVIQALWSAVRHQLPVKIIICNNRSYRLLQANISQYWSERGVEGRPFPLSFDLSNPELDFARLAAGFGVQALRVDAQSDLGAVVERFLSAPGPFLLDVLLEGDVHPELIGVRCGQ